MKIVYVSQEYPPATRAWGIGSYVSETAEGLAARGHEVTVVTMCSGGDQLPCSRSGVRVIQIPETPIAAPSPWAAVRLGLVEYRKRVAHCLREIHSSNGADIIEFPGFAGESHVWSQERSSVPVVVRLHGPTGKCKTLWDKYHDRRARLLTRWEIAEMEAAAQLTAVSGFTAMQFARRIPGDRVSVIHNSISAERWAASAQIPSEELRSDDILFVGTRTRSKGIVTLLSAVQLLRRKTAWGGRLVLVGRSGSQFEWYLRRRWLEDPALLVVREKMERHALAALYASAGVCCFPSLNEPFGYTCLEAMASGGLVVASQNTGLAEILSDHSGMLVSPGNPDLLAEALGSALKLGSRKSTQMRRAAQRRAHMVFDHSVILPQVEQLYEQLISRARKVGTRC